MRPIFLAAVPAMLAAANAMADAATPSPAASSLPVASADAPDREQATKATSIGIASSRESLSNGTPDWRESSLQFKRQFGKRHIIDLAMSETSRFGLRDNQVSALYSLPLSARLTGTIDAAASPTHRVLAREALGAALQFEFAPAWLLHVGARTTGYDDVRVNQATLMLEHYVSNFSWAVGWRPARAFDTTADSAEVRGYYYYGDKSSVGIIVSSGEEAANIGGRVTLTDVRALVLIGRHWLNDRWSVNYAAGRTRQGSFYTRNGINLGVQYLF